MEKMEVASNVPSEAGPSGEATDISAFEEQFPFGFVTLPPQEWSDYEEPPPLSPLEDEDLETGGSVADHDEVHDELLEKCNNTDVDGHAPNNTAVEE